MNTRLKELRKTMKLTQEEFGKRVGVKASTITGYELGTRAPSDAIILSICKEYGVNSQWLDTGEGEMFREQTLADRIDAFAARLGKEDDSSFPKRFVAMLEQLTPEHWALMAEMAEMVLETQNEKEGKHD